MGKKTLGSHRINANSARGAGAFNQNAKKGAPRHEREQKTLVYSEKVKSNQDVAVERRIPPPYTSLAKRDGAGRRVLMTENRALAILSSNYFGSADVRLLSSVPLTDLCLWYKIRYSPGRHVTSEKVFPWLVRDSITGAEGTLCVNPYKLVRDFGRYYHKPPNNSILKIPGKLDEYTKLVRDYSTVRESERGRVRKIPIVGCLPMDKKRPPVHCGHFTENVRFFERKGFDGPEWTAHVARVWASNSHVVASSLNGNNGEATNTDDVELNTESSGAPAEDYKRGGGSKAGATGKSGDKKLANDERKRARREAHTNVFYKKPMDTKSPAQAKGERNRDSAQRRLQKGAIRAPTIDTALAVMASVSPGVGIATTPTPTPVVQNIGGASTSGIKVVRKVKAKKGPGFQSAAAGGGTPPASPPVVVAPAPIAAPVPAGPQALPLMVPAPPAPIVAPLAPPVHVVAAAPPPGVPGIPVPPPIPPLPPIAVMAPDAAPAAPPAPVLAPAPDVEDLVLEDYLSRVETRPTPGTLYVSIPSTRTPVYRESLMWRSFLLFIEAVKHRVFTYIALRILVWNYITRSFVDTGCEMVAEYFEFSPWSLMRSLRDENLIFIGDHLFRWVAIGRLIWVLYRAWHSEYSRKRVVGELVLNSPDLGGEAIDGEMLESLSCYLDSDANVLSRLGYNSTYRGLIDVNLSKYLMSRFASTTINEFSLKRIVNEAKLWCRNEGNLASERTISNSAVYACAQIRVTFERVAMNGYVPSSSLPSRKW